MGCTVTSETIEILMNSRKNPRRAPMAAHRSALQNPDLSRAQLAALLRRGAASGRTEGRRKSLWTAFTDRHLGRHANSNG